MSKSNKLNYKIMYKKLLFVFLIAFVGVVSMSAQKRISGTVVDEQNEAIPGANVKVAGTHLITVTDAAGAFTFSNVPSSAKTLQVSCIGMEPTTAAATNGVRIVMKMKDNSLEEAVVVGYGTGQKIGTVVGSVKTVKSDAINGKPAVNVADALQGQVAGTQILNNTGDVADFTNMSINIRGVGSLNGGNDPLVVIDGSPAGSAALALLNSNDIESISILKDASATSIYGARAANGVMYITTKKGKRGEKAQIWVSQKMGWSMLANSISNPMNANELLDFQLENDIISVAEYMDYKKQGFNTDWQDYFFRKDAPMYQTDFSVRGGSEKTSYFISGSYMKQAGLTYQNMVKKYTLRTNIDSKVNDWFQTGISQNITYTDRHKDGYAGNGSGNVYSPSTGSYMYSPYWSNQEDGDHIFPNSPGVYNTRYLLDVQPGKVYDITYMGQAYVQLQPIRLEHHQLTWKTQLGLYASDSRSQNQLLPGTIIDPEGLGDRSRSTARSSQWTITNTLEYKFKHSENHLLTLLAGQEGIRYDYDAFSAAASRFTDERFPLLGQGPKYEAPGESNAKYEYLSFFGRADYALFGKYFFDFTIRNDASSRFGNGKRNALFLSGGAKWNLKAEEWLEYVSWLKDLNMKVSVGSTGNSEIGNYEHLGLVGQGLYGGEPSWAYTQAANPNLQWEKQIQFNWGFDVNFLDIVNLDFNVYKRKTKDMLLGVPLAYTTGFSSQMQNIGEMTNRGVEIELNVDAIKKKNGMLSFRFTYGYNVNRIDKLFHGVQNYPIKAALLSYVVGKSLNYYLPIYAGVDKEDGAPMWYKVGYNGDPVHEFNPETMTKNELELDNLYQNTGKSRYAPHNGGFGITASWKGLSLIADFTFCLGKWMVNNEYFFAASPGNAANGWNQSKDMLNIWKKPGDLADLPAYHYDYQFDTHVLERANFLRLKTLTLCYDLPKNWMEATGFISNVRFNFTGRNVFTVTPYRGADPEISSNISYGNFPATRQFTIGVEVTF